MKRFPLVLVLVALLAPPVLAQETGGSAGSSDTACEAGELNLADAESASGSATASSSGAYRVPTASDTPAAEVAPKTDAEAKVQQIIRQDGIHVVHFWAPWCPNAKNELEAGWAGLVEHNPDVSFTFVSIWNDGDPATSVLDQYAIPARVTTLQHPDLGPSDEEANRRKAFLGVPMTWSPSTWIFHNNGELAFALNYGEMQMETIQALLDATQKDW